MSHDTVCTDCGRVIDESKDQTGNRTPCPSCGSAKRTRNVEIRVQIDSKVEVYPLLKWLRKQLGRWGKDGFEFYRDTLTWRRLRRTFDKPNDWYEEEIRDAKTGDLIRECKEPLSKHRGRGSAKQRR